MLELLTPFIRISREKKMDENRSLGKEAQVFEQTLLMNLSKIK